jgi:hypothetical protein
MSWLSSAVGLGGSSGPSNPVPLPDLSYLRKSNNLNFLRQPTAQNLLNPGQYSFLKGGATNPYSNDLTDNAPSFADTYRAPRARSGLDFNQLLGAIDAPSSVDEVQSGVDSDRMKQLLAGIDTDTTNSVGSLKSDYLDRGLGGPGMISDIEANALAQARTGGDKAKAAARSDFATKELDRLKARETAQQAAYGKKYDTSVARDTQATDIASKGALQDSSIYGQLLGEQGNLASEDLNRGNQRTLSLADILKSNNQTYSTLNNSNSQLLAQLLNARDLGYATDQADLFNAGANRQAAGTRNGILDNILRNVQVNVSPSK